MYINLNQRQSAQAAKKRLDELKKEKQTLQSPPVATPARQGSFTSPSPRQILQTPPIKAPEKNTPIPVEESPAQVEETLKERGWLSILFRLQEKFPSLLYHHVPSTPKTSCFAFRNHHRLLQKKVQPKRFATQTAWLIFLTTASFTADMLNEKLYLRPSYWCELCTLISGV